MKLLRHTYILLSIVALMNGIPLAKISGAKDTSIPSTALEDTLATADRSLGDASPAAQYSESNNSWSFSASVLEIKDVSVYGRPGSIARIEYVHRGETREAWVALRIDGYSFSDGTREITVGDQITLRASGDYVSPKGVDWNSCPASDEFCQHASFIEGGFPTSEDFGGLTISPSNMFIHWGSGSADWINGMLAWRIFSAD